MDASKAIATYILPIGIMIFLVGLCIIESRSSYHSLLYLFISLPVLIISTLNPALLLSSFQSNIFKLICMLMSIAALSTLWNPLEIADFRHIRYLINIILFVLAFIYIHHYQQDLLKKMILLATIVWAISGIIDIYSMYYLQGAPLSNRIVGSGSLTNTLLTSHIYGVLTASLATYFLTKKHSTTHQVLIIGVFSALFIFIIQTHSRTPLLGLLAVFIALLLKHPNKKIIYSLTFLGTFLAIYLTFNLDLILQRGLSYRPEIWLSALNDISNRPLLGHGVGSQMSLYIPSLDKIFSDSHNIHIGLAYDLGLAGFITWLTLLGCAFKFHQRHSDNILVSISFFILIFGVVAGITEGGGFLGRPREVWFLIWLPIAMLVASDVQSSFPPHEKY